jgi:hypothetical protein
VIPIPVPDEAKRARGDCQLVDMGRPRGVPEDECGSAEMLIGGRLLTGFAGRAQYAYFKPSADELAQLNAGGFLEMCQIGTVVQPFSLVVWPAEPDAAEPKVEATWECALGGEEQPTTAQRNFMPPQYAVDGPVCDQHAAELRRGHGGAEAREQL